MFNAIKYTQELERAGFSREQAEASVKLLIEVMNENFTTKSDLKELQMALQSDFRDEIRGVENSLRSEVKEVENSLRTDIKGVEFSVKDLQSEVKQLEYRMVIKMGTMMTVAIGLTATLVKMIQTMG